MNVVSRILRWSACLLTLALGASFAWQLVRTSAAGKEPAMAAFDVLSWTGPWALLLLVTLLIPQFAVYLLGVGTAATIVLWGWWATDPSFWLVASEQRGPALVLAAVVLATSLGVLGLQAPGMAGLMLMALTVMPTMAAAIHLTPGEYSALTIASGNGPFFLAGMMLVVSAVLPERLGNARKVAVRDAVPDTRFAVARDEAPSRTW